MPHLARITIYLVKSLDGRDVSEAVVLPSGVLEHDRRFAIVDDGGEVVNGKRIASIQTIRSELDSRARTLAVGTTRRHRCRRRAR